MTQPSEAGGGQSGERPAGSGGARRRRRGGRGRGGGTRQPQAQGQASRPGVTQPQPQPQPQAASAGKAQTAPAGKAQAAAAGKAQAAPAGKAQVAAAGKAQAAGKGRGVGQGPSKGRARGRRPGAGRGQGAGVRGGAKGGGATGGAARPESDVAIAATAEDAGAATVLEHARADLLRDQRTAALGAHRRARLIAAVPGLFVFVVVAAALAAGVSPLAGLVAGLVAGFLWWVFTLRAARRMVLWAMKAQDLDVEGMARLENLVDGLCATMGLVAPAVLAVDDPSRNAIVVGLRPDDAVLVVTTGLLVALDPVALEGVLAHELTHIKNGDVAPATVAVAVLLPVAVLTPSVGATVHRWAGRGREFRADADAVRVTRYPPGLRDALATMAEGPVPRPPSPLAEGATARATRWLWAVALPGTGAGAAADAAVGELDAPAARIAALDER